MTKTICTDQLDAILIPEYTLRLAPRHLKLPIRKCCDETAYWFMYKFMDTSAKNRELVITLTAEGISYEKAHMSRRTYYRKRDWVKTFVDAGDEKCCQKIIYEFLDFFRDCSLEQIELILHLSKGGNTASNFRVGREGRLCPRQTVTRWVKKIVALNPKYGFLQKGIWLQDRKEILG